MAAGFDQAGVAFDSPDYTFDGTFTGITPTTGNLFLAAHMTARNTTTGTAANVVSNASSNTWSST